MTALVVVWVIVQRQWASAFSEHLTDDDALAERSTCGNCGCITICEKKKK